MTVSKDIRTKEYDGARSASSALKIEKVETHANIKIQGSLASVGTEQASPTSVSKIDANVIDLNLSSKDLKDFGVDLKSRRTPENEFLNTSENAPLKAIQAETNGPSYKLLIGIAAGLVVVIAGLALWSGGLDADNVVSAVDTPVAVITDGAVIAQTAAEGLVASPVATVSENEFVAQMTSGTIAALRAGIHTPVETAVINGATGDAKLAAATLFSLVLEATAKDLSMPEIDHMLNIAYTDGTIKVPELFLLSSGRVNTSAIMTAFVGQ